MDTPADTDSTLEVSTCRADGEDRGVDPLEIRVRRVGDRFVACLVGRWKLVSRKMYRLRSVSVPSNESVFSCPETACVTLGERSISGQVNGFLVSYGKRI